MDEEAMATRLEDTIWHTEVPTADVNGMARLALSEAAHAKGIKVVLTGEGADEHFAGYADFWADRFRESDQAWPASLSEGDNLFEAYQAFTKKPSIMTTLSSSSARVVSEETKKMLNYSATGCHIDRITQIPFAPWTEKLMSKAPETVLVENLSDDILDKIANKWHPLHTSEYIWGKAVLCNHILRYIGDNIDMVHHIETRPPFLDHKVTEYANNIPPSLKMKYEPGNEPFLEKHVLRQAMKPFITEEIYNRRKHPFFGPSKYTKNGPMHKICQKLLTKENVEQIGFIEWDTARDNMDRAFIEKDPFAMRRTLVTSQFVVLSQKFGVKKAEPPLDN
jgi:asparagine synthase (glutamine-hydrolysing)